MCTYLHAQAKLVAMVYSLNQFVCIYVDGTL